MTGKIDGLEAFTRPLEPPFDQMLRAELLYRDPIVLALPRDHLLGRRSGVTFGRWRGERFVLCTAGGDSDAV